MGTYSLEGLADFILQLYDEEREEDLWETWLHKDQKDDFKTFKKNTLNKRTEINLRRYRRRKKNATLLMQ